MDWLSVSVSALTDSSELASHSAHSLSRLQGEIFTA